jgi:putative PIN family toxin of toxin-antitoxin system
MRCVIDTSVLDRALRSAAGPSFRILEAIIEGKVEITANAALALEYEEVLSRPDHRAAHWCNDEQFEAILNVIMAQLVYAPAYWRLRPVYERQENTGRRADENDQMVVEAAINGGADVIITGNVKDIGPAADRYGIETLSPTEFLTRFEHERRPR